MGNETYFMGIDIGTFSSKGVITDAAGNVVARAQTAHGMDIMNRMQKRSGGMISVFCPESF